MREPGLAGDTLTLKQTAGSGALAFQLVNGVEEVIYTAPATVAASMLDAVSYTVTDQLGGTATGSASVQLDGGPTIASVTPAVVKKGQSTEIGTVAPGLAGDTLTLKQTGGGGALALQLVGGVEELIYTAPATVAASTLDAVSYTVTDQHNDAVATGSSTIPVASGTSSIIVGTAGHAVSAGNNNSVIDGRAGNEAIQAGNGTDFVLGGPNDTIQVGNGSDEIIGGAYNSITAGNGSDVIIGGANNTIRAGNGPDKVTGGPNDTVTLGDGSNTVIGELNDIVNVGNGSNQLVAAPGDVWTIGNGADDFKFASGFGNNTINGFQTGKDVLNFDPASPAPSSGGERRRNSKANSRNQC
jgi:hypothetical protein